MKRMLVNATQEEELRMALVDGQRLYDLNIETPSQERKKANIYKGKITRIEPSLEAAFVDYGADRHGFLPFKEVSPEYFLKEPESGGKPNIKEVLREGQDIVVQIDKEERGTKGAALTTFVSLAGRFLVLKPNKPKSGGVSRRIVGEDREQVRQTLDDLDVPDGMSIIVRTAGIDRSTEELKWDLENLFAVWEAILKVVVERPSPFLIYQESNAIIRALRDYLTNDIGEILIDDPKAYNEAREFVERVMPHNLRKLKYYDDAVPLFTRYQIESQIESAFAHSVILPAGGSLVIDHTEALVSVDINSARATKGEDIESTALNTNLEAADEIARQLRLRDLGGLVVIDFIDMGPQKNQREVENRLREAVRMDRARVQIGKISRFGLLEMSRQRLRPSLGESSHQICPRCNGTGNIRGVESLALAILRLVGEEARKERTSKVIAQLPVDVATYLLNEKRDWVQSVEDRNDVQVLLVANPDLETPNYSIRRVRDDQTLLPENTGSSYELAAVDGEDEIPSWQVEKKPIEKPAVTAIVPAAPAPPPQRLLEDRPQRPGLFVRLWRYLFATGEEDSGSARKKKPAAGSSSGKRGTGPKTRQGAKSKQQPRKDGDSRSRSAKAGGKSGARKTKKKKESKAAAKTQSQDRDRQQQDQPEQKKGRDDNQAASAEAEGGQKKRRGGRGRGGRRRRNPRSDSQGRDGSAQQQSGASEARGGKGDESGSRDSGPKTRPEKDDGKEAQAAGNGERRPPKDGDETDRGGNGSGQTKDGGKRQEERPPATADTANTANTAATTASGDKAGSPAKSSPGDRPAGGKPDQDRLLPWEMPIRSDPEKRYTVWSSTPEDDGDKH